MQEIEEILEILGERGLLVAALVLLFVLASLLIPRVLRRLSRASHMKPITASRLIGIVRWTSLMVLVLFILQISGAVGQAWAILSATLATLALGFVATWSLLSNVTSAIIVLAFRPFRVDDEIEVFEEEKSIVKGRVVDLNLMFTTIVDGDVASRVPNNFFLLKVTRVRRKGLAPDPREDLSSPFF